MTITRATKQRLIFVAILIPVVILTHFLYQAVNPQWISFRQAEDSYNNKQWDKAIELYQHSFDQGLVNSHAIERMADAYAKVKNYSKSIYWYKIYLAQKPDDIWAQRALAGIYTANGDFEMAAKEYQLIMEKEAKENKPLIKDNGIKQVHEKHN